MCAKVSVIIPVFNTQEKYLRPCIESILKQTLSNIEIIIIDDGSTTPVKKIIDSYSDERIKYIYQENKGLSGARNTGITASRGEYILFVDSDDRIAENTCEQLYARAIKNDLDILFFGANIFDDKTQITSDWDNCNTFPLALEEEVFDYKTPDVFDNLTTINPTAWTKFFKRTFLNNFNLRFTDGLIFEDTEFFFRYIFKAKKMSVIHSPLYYYRQNTGNSIIEKSDRKHLDCIKIFELIEQSLKENGEFERLKIKLYKLKLEVFKLRYKNIKKQFKKEFKLLIKKDLASTKPTKEEFNKLPGETQAIYNYFMCKTYFIKAVFKWFKKQVIRKGWHVKKINFFLCMNLQISLILLAPLFLYKLFFALPHFQQFYY